MDKIIATIANTTKSKKNYIPYPTIKSFSKKYFLIEVKETSK